MTVCKRIGAWLLTLVLLVSALPYTAFAASEDSHVVNATMEETWVVTLPAMSPPSCCGAQRAKTKP